jgi:hypothetical protein
LAAAVCRRSLVVEQNALESAAYSQIFTWASEWWPSTLDYPGLVHLPILKDVRVCRVLGFTPVSFILVWRSRRFDFRPIKESDYVDLSSSGSCQSTEIRLILLQRTMDTLYRFTTSVLADERS